MGKTAIMSAQTLTKAFVYLPGGGTVIYNSSGPTYYRHADWLGSSRLTSTPSRTAYASAAYAPYGEVYAKAGSSDPSFTGQNQDTTSTLYDFPYREYSPSQGRWPSPDPAGIAAVDPASPQTWNRYGYVTNNPLALVDPMGTCAAYDYSYTSGGLTVFVSDAGPCLDPNPGYSVCSGQGYYIINGAVACVPPANYASFVAEVSSQISYSSGAANSGTPTPKNPCVADALKAGARNVGIDLLGFLPEAGGVARVVGHQAGYVGKVADNLGKNMLTAGTKTTGTLASAIGFSSSDWTTWVSAGITAADFVPVLSDFTTPVAIAWDAGVAAYRVYQCPK